MSERAPHPARRADARPRLREFLREPEAVFWVFAFPLLLALALGSRSAQERTQEVVGRRACAAQGGDVGRRRAARGAGRARARALAAGRGGRRAAQRRRSRVVVVPRRDAGSAPTYRFDPTRPESRGARLHGRRRAAARGGARRRVAARDDQEVVAPGSRYIDWLLPGLLGMNIMGTGLWSIGFAVVAARTRKLLKRLIATPMPRGAYLLSHLLARLVFLVARGRRRCWSSAGCVFGVPLGGLAARWSPALALLGAFAFAGLGLLVASRARTIEAVSGLMNLVMLPMWLLSGVFFASANFPDVAQPFIRALPLTALNDALRGVMLEGRGVAGDRARDRLSAWGVVQLPARDLFRWLTRPDSCSAARSTHPTRGAAATPQLPTASAPPRRARRRAGRSRLPRRAGQPRKQTPIEEAEAPAFLRATACCAAASARARSARLTISSADSPGLNSVTPAQQVKRDRRRLAVLLVLVFERRRAPAASPSAARPPRSRSACPHQHRERLGAEARHECLVAGVLDAAAARRRAARGRPTWWPCLSVIVLKSSISTIASEERLLRPARRAPPTPQRAVEAATVGDAR